MCYFDRNGQSIINRRNKMKLDISLAKHPVVWEWPGEPFIIVQARGRYYIVDKIGKLIRDIMTPIVRTDDNAIVCVGLDGACALLLIRDEEGKITKAVDQDELMHDDAYGYVDDLIEEARTHSLWL